MKNAIKFLSLATLCIATVAMIGCSKDEEQPAGSDKVVVSTTTIGLESGAASKQLDESGTKTFAASEQIAVVYENTSSEMVKIPVTLAAGDISNGGKTATITVAMADPKANGTVKFIYPASMANDNGTVNYTNLYTGQDGTMATLSGNFDLAMCNSSLTAGADLPANPVLTNQFSVCKFTVMNTATSSDMTGSVTKLIVKHGSDVYVVNPATPGQSTFWVAVKPIDAGSGNINIYAAVGKNLYTKSVSSYTALAAGTFNRVTVGATQIPGALSGLFTVNAGGDQVFFSQGNLRYESSAWSFFPNQYDYYSTYSADAWDKFGWSTLATDYGKNTSEDNSDYSGAFVDWGNAMGSGWRTLTSGAYNSGFEWEYLFNIRTTPSGVRYAKATVNDKAGVILLPDDWSTSYHSLSSPNTANANYTTNTINSTDWTNDFEAHGAVFLPAAGYRYDGTLVTGAGSEGYYWSATQFEYDTETAYRMIFLGSGVIPSGNFMNRSLGHSVRLVKDL